MTESEFLASYDMTKYPRPSVTVDDVILSFDERPSLKILLIRRGGHPYLGKWALPGGFVATGKNVADRESPEDAVAREVLEETGVECAWSEQLFTYGAVDRDPRGHVISIAYISAIPTARLEDTKVLGGDDASDACWFELDSVRPNIRLRSARETLTERDLAFDHACIIADAIARIAGKLRWTDVATHFVGDGETFTMPQLRKFCETVLSLQYDKQIRLDPGNFHRDTSPFLELVPSKGKGPRGASFYRRSQIS